MKPLHDLVRTRTISRARDSVLLVLALLAFVVGNAAEERSQPPGEIITNIARLWAFPEQLRSNANPVKLEATVTYYDPAWGLLWLQEGGHGLFCVPKPPFPAIHPGQQVELSAFTKPGAREVVLSNAQYRVISETGLPAPQIINGPLPRSRAPDNVRCQIEGYIRSVQGGDSTHVRFEIIAGDMIVRAILLATNRSPWSVPEDSYIRVTGVFTPKFDRDKNFLDAQMVIPRFEDVELLQLLSSNVQFAAPLRAIASLHTSPSNELVRVQGTIQGQESGLSVVIQDGMGSVTVETWQTRLLKAGALVEAVGFPVTDGPALRLRQGLFRSIEHFEAIAVPPGTTNEQEELSLASQVRQLSPGEAAKGHAVRIVGVVTWADPETPKWFLQDSSGGIGVVRGEKEFSHLPAVGDWVEVRGITGDGGYSPVILNPVVSGRGVLKTPNARLLSLEQAVTGAEDSQWVEMRGYVRSVTNAPGLARIDVATSSGGFFANVRTVSRLKQLPGAVVRLRGVCAALSNDRRQLTGVQLWVPGTEEITVEEEAPKNPFSVPLNTIASLGQFSTSASLNRRAKIQGVVTLNAGRYFYLQDSADGLLVLTEQPNTLQRGDRVEAVGFPGREGRRLVLRDALFQKTSTDQEPVPVKVDPAQPLDEDLEGRLVVIEGDILQQTRTATGLQLTLRGNGIIFEAKLESHRQTLTELANGSHVALTGVYRIHYNESRAPEYFQLYLRSLSDVEILQRPSWWTPQRTVFALSFICVLSIVGTAWTLLIGRKNILLREQISERRHAEVQLQQAHAELEQRVRARTAELSRANSELQNEMTERERAESEVERVHKQLMDTARQAGMAEVATSVLHNVGNVLNSLNVSATLVAQGLKDSRVSNVTRLAQLLGEHNHDLAAFFVHDSRGKQIPDYVRALAKRLTEEQNVLLHEVQSLTDNVDHIKQIVAMQQSYAKVFGVMETLDPAELIENALLMHRGALARHKVEVICDYEKVPSITVDKHKVLQILINLIGNAKYAMDETEPAQKLLRVRLERNGGNGIAISVSDNGVGIPSENLSRIFQHGFTTKQDGHGFGLHSSAIAARELGGSLIAQSEGKGLGATFVLEIPVETNSEKDLCQN